MGRDIFDQNTFSINNVPVTKRNSETKQILVYWDISLSQGILGEERNREKDIRLMKKLLHKWKEDNYYLGIYLCLVNDKIEQTIQFSIGDEKNIIQLLNSIKYYGSTDLTALVKSSKDFQNEKGNLFSFCLIFSNGFDTFGNSNKADLFSSKANLPLFFCCSSGIHFFSIMNFCPSNLIENRNKMMDSWARLSGGDVSLCSFDKSDYPSQGMIFLF